MHKFVKRHVMFAWIAMLGILFGALAPAISHALAAAAAQADETVQVCTMEGMKTIVLAKTGTASGKPVSIDHVFKHCLYCATHGGTHPVLPTAQVAFALPDMTSSHPPLFYRSAAPLFAWTAAQPRGPPALA